MFTKARAKKVFSTVMGGVFLLSQLVFGGAPPVHAADPQPDPYVVPYSNYVEEQNSHIQYVRIEDVSFVPKGDEAMPRGANASSIFPNDGTRIFFKFSKRSDTAFGRGISIHFYLDKELMVWAEGMYSQYMWEKDWLGNYGSDTRSTVQYSNEAANRSTNYGYSRESIKSVRDAKGLGDFSFDYINYPASGSYADYSWSMMSNDSGQECGLFIDNTTDQYVYMYIQFKKDIRPILNDGKQHYIKTYTVWDNGNPKLLHTNSRCEVPLDAASRNLVSGEHSPLPGKVETDIMNERENYHNYMRNFYDAAHNALIFEIEYDPSRDLWKEDKQGMLLMPKGLVPMIDYAEIWRLNPAGTSLATSEYQPYDVNSAVFTTATDYPTRKANDRYRSMATDPGYIGANSATVREPSEGQYIPAPTVETINGKELGVLRFAPPVKKSGSGYTGLDSIYNSYWGGEKRARIVLYMKDNMTKLMQNGQTEEILHFQHFFTTFDPNDRSNFSKMHYIKASYSTTDVDLRDSDQDGLLDQFEQKIGTNPMNPDTDGDGRLDGDEVKSVIQKYIDNEWKYEGTDPLTPTPPWPNAPITSDTEMISGRCKPLRTVALWVYPKGDSKHPRTLAEVVSDANGYYTLEIGKLLQREGSAIRFKPNWTEANRQRYTPGDFQRPEQGDTLRLQVWTDGWDNHGIMYSVPEEPVDNIVGASAPAEFINLYNTEKNSDGKFQIRGLLPPNQKDGDQNGSEPKFKVELSWPDAGSSGGSKTRQVPPDAITIHSDESDLLKGTFNIVLSDEIVRQLPKDNDGRIVPNTVNVKITAKQGTSEEPGIVEQKILDGPHIDPFVPGATSISVTKPTDFKDGDKMWIQIGDRDPQEANWNPTTSRFEFTNFPNNAIGGDTVVKAVGVHDSYRLTPVERRPSTEAPTNLKITKNGDGNYILTGEGPAGANIKLYKANSDSFSPVDGKTATVSSDPDESGKYTFSIDLGKKGSEGPANELTVDGTELAVTATADPQSESAKTKIRIDSQDPPAPVVDPISTGDTQILITKPAEAEASDKDGKAEELTVTIPREGSNETIVLKKDSTGTWKIGEQSVAVQDDKLVVTTTALPATGDITVTAKDATGNTSTTTVPRRTDSPTEVKVVKEPQEAGSADPTKGDYVITGKAVPGSTVQLYTGGEDPQKIDGYSVVVPTDGENAGTFSIRLPKDKCANGTELKVTAKEEEKKESRHTAATVDAEAPTAPTIANVTEGDTSVTVTPTDDSVSMTVTIPADPKVASSQPTVIELTKDRDGHWTNSDLGLDIVPSTGTGAVCIPLNGEKINRTIPKSGAVTATAKDVAGNISDPAASKTIIALTDPPQNVKIVKEGDNYYFTGTAEPGSAVQLYEVGDSGNTKLNGSSATADTGNGTFKIEIPEANVADGNKFAATAHNTAAGKAESRPSATETLDAVAPTAPSIDPVSEGDTSVTVTPTDDSVSMTVTIPADPSVEGSQPTVIELTKNSDGHWKNSELGLDIEPTSGTGAVTIPLNGEKINRTIPKTGDVTATAKDAAGNISSPAARMKITARTETEPPAHVKIVKEGDNYYFTGTAENGSTVQLYEVGAGGNTKLSGSTVTASDENGSFKIEIPADKAENGNKFAATAHNTKEGKAESRPSDTETLDTVAPSGLAVDQVSEGDTSVVVTPPTSDVDTITITVPGSPNDEVIKLTKQGESDWKVDGTQTVVVPDVNGKLTVSLTTPVPAPTTVKNKVTVAASDETGNSTTVTEDIVARTPAPTDVAVKKKADGTGYEMTGKAEPGSTVQLENSDGTRIGEPVQADTDGSFTITVPEENATNGAELKVVATAEDKAPSEPASAIVDTKAPTAPTIATVTEGDTSVTVTPTEDSVSMTVTIPADTTVPGSQPTVIKLTKDRDGHWTNNDLGLDIVPATGTGAVTIPLNGEKINRTLPKSGAVTATAKDAAGNISDPAASKTITALTDPPTDVKIVKEGDNYYFTGTAENGSTVQLYEVGDDGNTKLNGSSATADTGNGSFKIEIPAAKAVDGNKFAATAHNTAAGKAESRPSATETLDTVAPSDLAVDPVKEGDTSVVVTPPTSDVDTITITVPGTPDKTVTVTKQGDGTWKTEVGKTIKPDDKTGKIAIPTGPIPKPTTGKDKVTVAASDATGNTRTVDKEIVPKTAAPTDVKVVREGDDYYLTGKATDGATVQLYKYESSSDAPVKVDGSTASVPTEGGPTGSFKIKLPTDLVKTGQELSATAETDTTCESDQSSKATVTKDVLGKTTIDTVAEGDTGVTVTPDPGATKLTIKVPVKAEEGHEGDKPFETIELTKDSSGHWKNEGGTIELIPDTKGKITVPVSKPVAEPTVDHNTVTVTTADNNGNSVPTTKTVIGRTETPTDVAVKKKADGTGYEMTGKAEPGSTVQLEKSDGTKIGEPVPADTDGSFTITVPEENATNGAELKVVATAEGQAPSEPASAIVDTKAPTAVSVDPIKEGDESIKITPPTEPSDVSKITIEVPGTPGETIVLEKDGDTWKHDGVPVTTDDDGKLIINTDKPIPGAGKVKVTTEDETGNQTTKEESIIGRTPDPEDVKIVRQDDGSYVMTGKAVPGSNVQLKDEGGNPIGSSVKVPSTGEDAGKFSIPIPADYAIDKTKFKVSATESGKPESTDVETTLDASGPTAPAIKPVKEGDTKISVTPPDDASSITVTVPGDPTAETVTVIKDGDQWKVGDEPVTVNEDGSINIPLTKSVPESGTVTVVAKDETGNPSKTSEAEIVPTPTTDAPTNVKFEKQNSGYVVSGEAPAGSLVVLKDNDGNKIGGPVTANDEGKFIVSVPNAYAVDKATLKVTAQKSGEKESAPTSVTADTMAPAAPSVTPPVAEDTALVITPPAEPTDASKITITIPGEPGETIELEKKDGKWMKGDTELTPNADGAIKVPVSPLPNSGQITVTTSDDAGNTSTTTANISPKPTDTDRYNATPKVITVPKGSDPPASDCIANFSALPQRTTATYVNGKPDTSTKGPKSVKIKVTYPDDSYDIVNTTVNVQSDADANTPINQDIKINKGETPVAKDGIKNFDQLPEGTKAEFKPGTTLPTEKGSYPVDIVVTYPDGSSDTVSSSIVVSTQADHNVPVGQDITVKMKKSAVAKDGIKNFSDLPEGTTVEFKGGAPSTDTAGRSTVTLIVKYKDGSSEEVTVGLIVRSDADDYQPVNQDVTVDKGVAPVAKDAIANIDKLPEGTTAAFEPPVSTDAPGDYPATVVVTYPDGSQESISTTVKVRYSKDTYVPEPKTIVVNGLGGSAEAKDGIANRDAMPDGTTYTFKGGTPSTATAGSFPVTIVVKYKDGSSEEVNTTLQVNSYADNDVPAPKEIVVSKGTTLTDNDAKDGIANLSELPNVAGVKFKGGAPSTNTEGRSDVTLVVTYKDGSSEEVQTTLNVKTAADLNDPQPKQINASVGGSVPTASNGIANLSELPAGTTVSYTNGAPSVSEEGSTTVGLTVTYPDGSVDYVATEFVVTDHRTQKEKYQPEGQKLTIAIKTAADPKAGVKNLGALPTDTKVTFTDGHGPNTTVAGTGTVGLTVTYPDGSYETLTVPYEVFDPGQQKDKYTPVGKGMSVDAKSPAPAASAGIANLNELPAGTRVTYKNGTPSTDTPGKRDVELVVTYPDHSSETIKVTLDVIGANEKYTPTGKEIVVEKGQEPDPAAGVENAGPKVASIVFRDGAPDTSTPGDISTVIRVTYTDGTHDDVSTNVHVKGDADNYQPVPQNINVDKGSDQPDAKSGIANMDKLPAGTSAAFKTSVDTDTTGTQTVPVIVTYADGSSEEVNVTVIVTDAATKNVPVPQNIEVEKDTTLTPEIARSGIANLGDLTKVSSVSFEGSPSTATAGNFSVTLLVKYSDGSSETVNTTLVVTDQAGRFVPVTKDIEAEKGKTPSASDGIANKDDLPPNTKYEFVGTVPTDPGTHEVTIKVTYPDGSSETVKGSIVITTAADRYQPEGKDIEVQKGKIPEAKDGIANLSDLPASTTVTFKGGTPSTTEPGTYPVTLIVTYPDASWEEVNSAVTVTDQAGQYTPIAADIKTNKGTPGDPKDGIANYDDLPTGTTAEYVGPAPDWSKPGKQDVTIKVTYPDGSSETVTTSIYVKTDADNNMPVPRDIVIEQGKTPSAEDGIENLSELPGGTSVAFKGELPDLNKPGEHPVTLIVTYPDGSTTEVGTTLTITEKTPEKDLYQPQPEPIKLKPGERPRPEDAIRNMKELPEGTTVAFDGELPDLSKPGKHKVDLIVTYPDGSSEKISTTIEVSAPVKPEEKPTALTADPISVGDDTIRIPVPGKDVVRIQIVIPGKPEIRREIAYGVGGWFDEMGKQVPIENGKLVIKLGKKIGADRTVVKLVAYGKNGKWTASEVKIQKPSSGTTPSGTTPGGNTYNYGNNNNYGNGTYNYYGGTSHTGYMPRTGEAAPVLPIATGILLLAGAALTGLLLRKRMQK